MPYSKCVRCQNCDGFPCLVHAKSDAEVLGVRPALEHANVTLRTNAHAVRLETNTGGNRGDRRRRRARRRRPRPSRPTSSCSPAVRRTRRSCCSCRPSDTHPQRARQRLRPGRPQLHVPQQPGRAGAVARGEPDRLPEDAGAERLLPRRATTSSYPLGNIQMVGKSQAPMFRGERPGETKLAPEWSLERVAKHAIDFWLSTEDLPRPDNRVTVDGDGKVTLAYTPTNDEPKKQLYAKLRSMLEAPRHARRPPAAAVRLHEERDPGRRRGAPGRHVPVRHRPGDLGAERGLPGARGRQPLRRRHERVPVDRRCQPGADRDGELAARRRPPARAARRRPAPR